MDLRTSLNGKTVLIFAAREPSAIAWLFRAFGAEVMVFADQIEALAAIEMQAPNGALLNVAADPTALFEISELLEARGVPHLFAQHAEDLRLTRFEGICFPRIFPVSEPSQASYSEESAKPWVKKTGVKQLLRGRFKRLSFRNAILILCGNQA